MKDYSFALEVEGFDVEDDAQLDALYDSFEEVGAAAQAGRVLIDFVVTATGAYEALQHTTARLEAEVPGVHVVKVDRDLVSIPDIATRTERTPEGIRLLVNGKRGSGGFPAPCGALGGGTRVWEWARVADWFAKNYGTDDSVEYVDLETATLFDAWLLTRYRTEVAPRMLRRSGSLQHASGMPSTETQTYDQPDVVSPTRGNARVGLAV